MKFVTNLLLVFSLLLLAFGCNQKPSSDNYPEVTCDFQPNILWISVEDISPYLAVYGDSTIETPNIDQLADEGVVFTHAYTTGGVCSASRNAILTSMYQTTTGGHHHRSWNLTLPDSIKHFPALLKEAGYYTTNNSKTDYNLNIDFERTWDESSNKAHWTNREPGQPFFAVFNHHVTHESRLWIRDSIPLSVNPDAVPVPPYMADDSVIRHDVARNYDNIKALDKQVGEWIETLEKEGLLDSTIVVFWSDHGGPLIRQKREVHESGIHVPLIVRLPNALHGGTKDNRLTSFIDLGPTMLSLAGIETPAYMQGQPQMGRFVAPERNHLFAAVDRMDDQYDMQRAVLNHRFKYIRNYYPEFPDYHPIRYRYNYSSIEQMLKLKEQGRLNEVQMQWFEATQPVEELYDLEKDPFETNNLAEDPQYRETLLELREEHFAWRHHTLDLGLIPEAFLQQLAEDSTTNPYAWVRNNPDLYSQVEEVADASLSPSENTEFLLTSSTNDFAPIRYWAALGLARMDEKPEKVTDRLITLAQDPSWYVKLSSAKSLVADGREEYLQVFQKAIKTDDFWINLLAFNYLHHLQEKALPILSDIKAYDQKDWRYPYDAKTSVVEKLEEKK